MNVKRDKYDSLVCSIICDLIALKKDTMIITQARDISKPLTLREFLVYKFRKVSKPLMVYPADSISKDKDILGFYEKYEPENHFEQIYEYPRHLIFYDFNKTKSRIEEYVKQGDNSFFVMPEASLSIKGNYSCNVINDSEITLKILKLNLHHENITV